MFLVSYTFDCAEALSVMKQRTKNFSEAIFYNILRGVRKSPALTITLFSLCGKLRKCANHAVKNARYRRSIRTTADGGRGTFILIRP